MSRTFTKLFSGILESTVWCEPLATRVCWIAMLAMADRHGRVWSSLPGLAKRAGISLDEAKAAVDRFLAPDAYSRTPDFEGRRIEQIDGGWRLLNHAKYRALRDEDERREYQRHWDREHRGKSKNPTRSDRARPRPTQAEAEADSEAEAVRSKTLAPSASNPTPAKSQDEAVEHIPLCDGTEYPVPKSMLAELDRLYPAVDPVQTLREIRGWNLANKTRRKTRRGIERHIFDWFQREQDKQSRKPA
jgi:hypothetical protein